MARWSRRTRAGLLVAAAVLAVAIGVLLLSGDDDQVATAPATSSSTTSTATSSTSTTPTTTVVLESIAVWPQPGSPGMADARAAASAFATEYLGMTAPVVGELQQGDSRSGEVEVRPRVDGPVTTVLVRMLGSDDGWSVLGAATADIELTSPDALDEVTSPVVLTGRALAFEGTVDVEVREDGADAPLGTGFVTGGGDVMRPFSGEVPFVRTPAAPAGAIVLLTRSAEDGAVWSASVVRVRFGEGPAVAACAPTPVGSPEPDEMLVTVAFSCDSPGQGGLVAVQRLVPRTPGKLRATVTALLAGPTSAERQRQIGSWFSDATAGALRSVDLDDGHAAIDFAELDRLIPNASSSAGSERLLAELDHTVLGVDGVTSAEYRLDGSCEDFGLWLQMDGCLVRTEGEAR